MLGKYYKKTKMVRNMNQTDPYARDTQVFFDDNPRNAFVGEKGRMIHVDKDKQE